MADPEARVVVTATDQTARAFASADRSLQTFARGALKVRSALAGFGVVLSGRAFASWIARSIETTEAVGEQGEKIKLAQTAMKEFKKSSDELAESLAVNLTPAITLLSRGLQELRGILAPTKNEMRDRAIAGMQDEIDRLIKGLNAFEQGKWWTKLGDASIWEKNREEIEKLRVALAKLYEERDGARAPPAFFGNDFFGGGPADASQVAFQKKMREEQERAAEAIAKGKDLSPELAAFVTRLEAAEKLTASMSTDVEKQVDEWREAKSLFDEGLISAETLRRIDESQLGPIKVTAQRMKVELKDLGEEARRLAQSMGDSFQDAFADWVLGAERSFGDLLKRMAVQFATSAIFKGIGSLFPGGGFLSNFFGGFRAGGGPVSSGKGYIVGERGPEWFMPGQSGMISPGGGAIVINQSNTFHGGDQRQQMAALAANNARLKQELKAEISDSRRRGRPI